MSRARRSPLVSPAASVLLVPLPAHAQELPFRDPDLPRAARIDDLLGRLTVDERVSLLHRHQPAMVAQPDGGYAPACAGNDARLTASAGTPAGQRAVSDAVPRTTVVLESGYPYSGDRDTADLPAVLWTTHAGQETGHALVDVLFGDHNPSGKLTRTWYRSDKDLPDKPRFDIAKSGHTYRYFRGDVDLGRSSRSLTARVANPDAPTTAEVRLGGPTGRLVGTLAVPGTADEYSWTDVSTPLRAAAGRQDLYLVFSGKARIDNLTVEG